MDKYDKSLKLLDKYFEDTPKKEVKQLISEIDKMKFASSAWPSLCNGLD